MYEENLLCWQCIWWLLSPVPVTLFPRLFLSISSLECFRYNEARVLFYLSYICLKQLTISVIKFHSCSTIRYKTVLKNLYRSSSRTLMESCIEGLGFFSTVLNAGRELGGYVSKNAYSSLLPFLQKSTFPKMTFIISFTKAIFSQFWVSVISFYIVSIAKRRKRATAE